MEIIKWVAVGLSSIALVACVTGKKEDPCLNMHGQYQRIDARLAIKDNRNIFLYLKHIPGTTNGFNGIADYEEYKQVLQPLVRENPHCKVIFEGETFFYNKEKVKYGCEFILRDNADEQRFYCLRKISNKIPEDISNDFIMRDNPPYFNKLSEVGSMIEWNRQLQSKVMDDNS